MDRSKVHRILQKQVPAAPAAQAVVDLITSLLTRAERVELGLSPGDVPNALQRYRILMFRSSAAGDGARAV